SAQLRQNALGMRAVMDNPERVDKVVRLDWYNCGKLFSICMVKGHSVRETQDLRALSCDLQRLLGEINGGDYRAMSGKGDRVRTNTAADFKHSLVLPSGKFGKCRDMRLDEIFSLLDFIEIAPGADRLV